MVFDNKARPETADLRCRWAWGTLLAVDCSFPTETAYPHFFSIWDAVKLLPPWQALASFDLHIRSRRSQNRLEYVLL